MSTEHAIQQQILVAIGSRPGVLAWRQNVGRAPSSWRSVPEYIAAWIKQSMGIVASRIYVANGRLVQYGTPGMADIMIVVNGRLIAVEVKAKKGRQSQAQKRWQEALEAAGGRYVLARSVADVMEAMAWTL